MLMPEATMHKDNCSAGGENYVRFAWQIFAVKTVTVAHTMNEAAYGHFRAGILAAYTPHVFATAHFHIKPDKQKNQVSMVECILI